MKKSILSRAIICMGFPLLFSCNLSSKLTEPATHPAPGFSATLSQPDSTLLKFRLSVKNPAGSKLDIRLIDLKFGPVNQKTTTDTGFQLTYDLSDVPDGVYYILVKGEKEKIRKKIMINTEQVEARVASISGTGESKKQVRAF